MLSLGKERTITLIATPLLAKQIDKRFLLIETRRVLEDAVILLTRETHLKDVATISLCVHHRICRFKVKYIQYSFLVPLKLLDVHPLEILERIPRALFLIQGLIRAFVFACHSS